MIGGTGSMRIRGTLFAVPLLLATTALYAQEYGSADEAKAMLESTVTQMKANKEQTISQINNGDIKDKDLYPYCGGPDGMVTAHPDPNVRTMSLKNLKDKEGKAFLEDVYDNVEEGEITEVEYVWTRPGEDEPVQKVAYLTKVDDQVCGVGYYKE
jgi:signal transduction histidine kinase